MTRYRCEYEVLLADYVIVEANTAQEAEEQVFTLNDLIGRADVQDVRVVEIVPLDAATEG